MPTMNGNVLNWASDIEPDTILQAQKAARLPFVAGHVALMADAHVGFGATIGSVIPTEGAVVPSAVGVDIGCGMIACHLPLTSKDLPDNLDELHHSISRSVPAGVGQGHASARQIDKPIFDLTDKELKAAETQMGSLGSGNHFVEVCLDENDGVWVVLHSGSRGVGNQLATRYIDKAKANMKAYFIHLEDPDLAYLVEGTDDFNEYIAAMLWAQDWALVNRETMMDAVLKDVRYFLSRHDLREVQRINSHHNFCVKENHHGRNVWLTRKGAIRARQGDLGIIPGSMGTRSYIVEGLGNPASYNSCSHGAGRRLSRGQAKRSLDIDEFRKQMAGKSWDADNAAGLLDEAPKAYKQIEQVMADQADLVRPLHELHQILSYKGS